MNFFYQIAATILILFFLDAGWLNFLIAELVDWPAVYRFGNHPNWPFAEFYYGLMGTWLSFRYAYPAILERDTTPAIVGGAGLGLAVSSVYAAVNQLVFIPWSIDLIILDIAWNTAIFSLSALLSSHIGYWLETHYPENTNIQRT